MAVTIQYPKVYNTTSTALINGASSGAMADFGFLASYVRVENLGTVPLYLDFKSTVGSTAGFKVESSSDHRVWEYYADPSGIGRIARVNLYATSTTAAVPNVLAIG